MQTRFCEIELGAQIQARRTFYEIPGLMNVLCHFAHLPFREEGYHSTAHTSIWRSGGRGRPRPSPQAYNNIGVRRIGTKLGCNCDSPNRDRKGKRRGNRRRQSLHCCVTMQGGASQKHCRRRAFPDRGSSLESRMQCREDGVLQVRAWVCVLSADRVEKSLA